MVEFMGFGAPSPGQVEGQMRKLRKELADLPYDLSKLKKENEPEYRTILDTMEIIYQMVIKALNHAKSKKAMNFLKDRKAELEGIFKRADAKSELKNLQAELGVA